MNDSNNRAAGVGFAGLLAIAFIVLKLCHVIDWSWVWVLSPIWISLSISLVVLIVIVIYCIATDKKVTRR